MGFTPKQKKTEEIFNTISHAVGIPISIAVLALLIVFASLNGTAWHIVSYSIFGTSMLLLYLASTLFHASSSKRTKYYLNKFDHAAIYILIAGTYTPIALVSLNGLIGWLLFGIIWALAIGGMVFKIWFYNQKYRKISAWLYVAMGWLIVIAIVPLVRATPTDALWFLISGGVLYTIGALFYLRKNKRFSHFIFHLFVIGGSVCHFFCFLVMVI
ncbi:MAG: hemolysin III family protein [Bacteroidetes bacterium]|nr:hemolysin III family protein [Bacteroidota bacterium]MBU1579229.1 hemolysin III family protein [Bacteroidota bacterium]MBU2465924.1 hemolysin III family protein [Bacteroidota bacterium]MBU2557984.1 hemolysin III family protein [Bacteroidota bacterium]